MLPSQHPAIVLLHCSASMAAQRPALVTPPLERLRGAHLVVHSYGGAVALKAASLTLAFVRSATAYAPVFFRALFVTNKGDDTISATVAVPQPREPARGRERRIAIAGGHVEDALVGADVRRLGERFPDDLQRGGLNEPDGRLRLKTAVRAPMCKGLSLPK